MVSWRNIAITPTTIAAALEVSVQYVDTDFRQQLFRGSEVVRSDNRDQWKIARPSGAWTGHPSLIPAGVHRLVCFADTLVESGVLREFGFQFVRAGG